MNDDRLWAPWRLEYVAGDKQPPEALPSSIAPPEPNEWLAGADHDCFLCRDAAMHDSLAEVDRQLLVAARGEQTVIVLNRYPYNNGHLLVAPRRHVGELHELTPQEHLDCMGWLGRLMHVMRDRLHPDGFNIGLNLGRVAGAGLPGHLHWHIVPRWSGDCNFMTALAGTRVIPQSLDALWQLLRKSLDDGAAEK